MCSARPSLAPSVCAIVSVTSAGSRSVASPTQKTPALYSGTSSAAASIASRVLPVPPGPVSVTRRAPSSKQRQHLQQLAVAADERAGRARQVRVGDRLQRREGAVAELEDRDRLGDVLEPVLAEIGELDARRARASQRERIDLAAVARSGDAGGEVDVVADVALVGEQRRARVQADPHLDRPRRQRLGHRLAQPRALPAPWGRRRRTRRPACPPRRRRRRRRPRGSRGGARRAPRRTPRRRARAAASSSPRRP